MRSVPHRLTRSAVTAGGGAAFRPTFFSPLMTSLVPVLGLGSPTFLRATAATIDDWEGIIRTVLPGEIRFRGARRVRNRLSSTNDFTGIAFSLTNATLTANISDPSGGTSAFTITGTGVSARITQAFTGIIGDALINTLYVRRRTGTSTVLMYTGADAAVTIDITSVITSSWQRISAGVATTTNTTNMWGISLTSGDALDIWHPQQESVIGQSNQNPSEYVSAGELSSPYHGANVDGVQYFPYQNGNTVVSNVVTEGRGATLASTVLLGFLKEGARTNNCLWNRDFTNAAWAQVTMTRALDQIGIDGVPNAASSLLATGANSTVKQTITLAAVNRPFSVYIKRLIGTGNIDLAQDGATYTTQTVPSDGAWHRCTLVASQLNPILSIRLVTSGNKIAVDYAALEDAGGGATTFASSPIATTTVAVTRNDDLLTFPSGGNVIGAGSDSIYLEATPNVLATGTAQVIVQIDDGTNNNRMIAALETVTSAVYWQTLVAGVEQAKISLSNAVVGTTFKMGGRAGANNFQAAKDGVLGTPDVAGTFPASFTTIRIGNDVGSAFYFGTIRNLRIWTSALSDAQLVGLTT